MQSDTEEARKKISFKSIRKIFTSRAKNVYPDLAYILTDHTSGSVLDKNYHDPKEFFARVEKEFSVLGYDFQQMRRLEEAEIEKKG